MSQIVKTRKARKFMLQLVYQWHLAGQSAAELIAQNHEGSEDKFPLFSEEIQHFMQHVPSVEACLNRHLDREKHKISAIEWSILMLGCHELMRHRDQPAHFPKIITESMLLANDFVVPASIKYVNAVLDSVAKEMGQEDHGRSSDN